MLHMLQRILRARRGRECIESGHGTLECAPMPMLLLLLLLLSRLHFVGTLEDQVAILAMTGACQMDTLDFLFTKNGIEAKKLPDAAQQ